VIKKIYCASFFVFSTFAMENLVSTSWVQIEMSTKKLKVAIDNETLILDIKEYLRKVFEKNYSKYSHRPDAKNYIDAAYYSISPICEAEDMPHVHLTGTEYSDFSNVKQIMEKFCTQRFLLSLQENQAYAYKPNIEVDELYYQKIESIL